MYLDNTLKLALERDNYPMVTVVGVMQELFNMAYDEDCSTIRLMESCYSDVAIHIPWIPDMYQLGTDYGYETVQAVLRNVKEFTQRWGYEVSWKTPLVKVCTTHDLNCASLEVCKIQLENILIHMINV